MSSFVTIKYNLEKKNPIIYGAFMEAPDHLPGKAILHGMHSKMSKCYKAEDGIYCSLPKQQHWNLLLLLLRKEIVFPGHSLN